MTRTRWTFILPALMLLAAPVAQACPECGCEAKTTKAVQAVAATEALATDATKAAPVVKAEAPEPDRQAILAMAGEFEVKFQFQETVGLVAGYELKDPYYSEATEFVEVIEDRGDFISLQHILVLKAEEEGQEDRVVKHWRQDWTYQDTHILEFRGNLTWEMVHVAPETVKGTWSQAVYQVDDSPRYESFGKWVHTGDRSAWESGETWRPLPRREFSKRSDYQVLLASNRHTITPRGWVHEQDNGKLVLDDAGQPQTVIAHESGLNVYDRTDAVDFTAGRVYWEETAAYWQDVRAIWANTFAADGAVALAKEVDGKKLFVELFTLASDVRESGHSDATRQGAKDVVSTFLVESN